MTDHLFDLRHRKTDPMRPPEAIMMAGPSNMAIFGVLANASPRWVPVNKPGPHRGDPCEQPVKRTRFARLAT